jgi:hypothetical protein
MGTISQPHILIAAKDAGGCNAILPVARALARRGCQFRALAQGPAVRILRDDGLSVEETDEVELSEESLPYLSLVGNSWGLSVEDQVVEKSRALGVTSVGVLDSWVLSAEKFTNGSSRWWYLPDRLVVMDQLMSNELVAAGAPSKRLVALGQPHFDSVFESGGQITSEDIDAFRADLGVGKGQLLVVILSQNMGEFYGEGQVGGDLGYTEYDVARDVARAVSNLSSKGIDVKLVVKLHPREPRDKFSNMGLTCLRDAPPHLSVMAADLVIGMHTMLLLEAALLGCVCLSYQPNLRHTDVSGLARYCLGERCYESQGLEPAMYSLLLDVGLREEVRGRAKDAPIVPGATQRVVDFILSCVENAPAI